MKTRALMAMAWLAWTGSCLAQGPGAVANSTVKVDALSVYSEPSASSNVVRAVKKGDTLFVNLELKTGAERWCSVRLPGERTRIGYVQCDGLERSDRRSGDLALPSDAPPASGAPTIVARSVQSPPIRLPRERSALESTSEYGKVGAAVVHDGLLDGAKIAEFDQAAQGGSAAAMARAALAHDAAANFELDHNDSDHAIEQFRAALPLAAKQPIVLFGTLIGLSQIHLVRSEYSEALEYLGQARRISPGSSAVAQLSGWAYYGLNRLDDAIKEWDASQRVQPNPQIAALLENARRDQGVEQQTRSGETSHFILHYQGGATPQLANEILHALEEQFRALQTDLRFTPAEPIGVILYTEQSFRDITRAPSWAGGLNDGRIRVPVQGLDSVTEDLSRVLKHELTHSFVQQMTLGRCPTWLNEGLAQWMEGRRSAENAHGLIGVFDRGQFIPLKHLEGPWTAFPAPLAGFAYAWSLAAVESVTTRSGPMTINRLLGNLSTAPSVEDALREALQFGYADLDRQTADYLRQTYKE
jgi:tetratricopeptide (TPR) repeat protein